MAKTTKSTPKKNIAKTSRQEKKTKKLSAQRTSSQKKKDTKKKEEELQKIRIKIRAYDHRLIDESARKIIDNTIRQGVKFLGPVPLPTEKRKWTVNRSTFVHKDARDQYEMRIYKRIIDIINPGSKLIDSLSRLDLPAGVDIEIKY